MLLDGGGVSQVVGGRDSAFGHVQHHDLVVLGALAGEERRAASQGGKRSDADRADDEVAAAEDRPASRGAPRAVRPARRRTCRALREGGARARAHPSGLRAAAASEPGDVADRVGAGAGGAFRAAFQAGDVADLAARSPRSAQGRPRAAHAAAGCGGIFAGVLACCRSGSCHGVILSFHLQAQARSGPIATINAERTRISPCEARVTCDNGRSAAARMRQAIDDIEVRS